MLQNDFHNKYYADNREYFRTYKAKALEFLPKSPCRVLDVGCATGVNSENIKKLGHRLVGVDSSETAIKKYNEKGFEGYPRDINQPFPASWGESFDAVWAADILEHLESPENALLNMSLVLKNQGILILTIPNSSWFVYRILCMAGKTMTQLQHPHHIRFFNIQLISELLKKTGFKLRTIVGRNNIFIFPDEIKFRWLVKYCTILGIKLTKEWSIKHSTNYWHLSYFGRFGISWLADNLIVIGQKE